MDLILIAEDEPKIAAFMEKGLQRAGFATDVVSDGHKVLEKLADRTFALLLLDLGLPGQDGTAILAQMLQQQIRIPVIVVTAREVSLEESTVVHTAALDVITKPFFMKDLITKIKAIVP